jgi:hypothetical protein
MVPRWDSHPICMITRIGSCFYPELVNLLSSRCGEESMVDQDASYVIQLLCNLEIIMRKVRNKS